MHNAGRFRIRLNEKITGNVAATWREKATTEQIEGHLWWETCEFSAWIQVGDRDDNWWVMPIVMKRVLERAWLSLAITMHVSFFVHCYALIIASLHSSLLLWHACFWNISASPFVSFIVIILSCISASNVSPQILHKLIIKNLLFLWSLTILIKASSRFPLKRKN